MNGFPVSVLVTMAAIVVMLAIASLASALLGRLRPGPAQDNLRLRVRTWWQMVAVFLLALVVGRAVSIAFFALLSFLALKEYFSLIPTRRPFPSSSSGWGWSGTGCSWPSFRCSVFYCCRCGCW